MSTPQDCFSDLIETACDAATRPGAWGRVLSLLVEVFHANGANLFGEHTPTRRLELLVTTGFDADFECRAPFPGRTS